MSVDVFLQTLDGKKLGHVYDLDNMLSKAWPIENNRFPLLQYIDPYGDAFFNGSKMGEVITELHLLVEEASSDALKQLLKDVIELALRCQREPHTFLRFLGD